VLLSEPPRSQGDLNFSLFGIPVRVHPFFWITSIVLGPMNSREPDVVLRVAFWVVAVFFAILVHELGHALAMRAFGFRPWIVLYAMGGLASYGSADGRARHLTRPRQIFIHFAGPLAGFLLAAAIVVGMIVLGYGDNLRFAGPMKILPVALHMERQRVEMFINYLFFICTFWGLINLLPILPLDGGQIARDVLTAISPRRGYRFALMVSMFCAASLAAIGGVVLQDVFIALFFGYLAYSSYVMLQSDRGGRGW
jgi:stage IV sporulation protein FB